MTENSKDNLSPDDYFSLGNLYQHGDDEDDDFTQDYDMAFFCYEKAAKKGHAEAQLALGLMCASGTGVVLDFDEAIKWIRKAAKRGSTNAQDFVPIFENILVDEDDAEACFMLGSGYAGMVPDSEMEKNFEQAAFWCRKAIEQGHEEAEELLSFLEFTLGDVEVTFAMAMSYYFGSDTIEQNYEEAEVLFRQAVRKNHAGAKYMLAQMYNNGEGLHSDEYDVLTLIRESAKQGDVDAQVKLGSMYMNGETVELDYEKALFWIQKAAEQGNEEAQSILSDLDDVTENDDEIDFEQVLSLAEEKNTSLQSLLGKISAFVQGHEEAQSLLYDSDVDDVAENDDEPDFEQMLSLAQQGNFSAQFELANAYFFGTIDEIEQDYDQAEFWFKKGLNHPDLNACPDVIPTAQFLLGVICQDKGKIDDAQSWFHQAAEKGYVTAQSQLGKNYLLGHLGIKKDESKALFWYLKAAEQGDETSHNHLAYMYLNGCGVEVDNEKAAFWIKEAAELGNAESQRNLGVMYKDGQGLKQSDKKAIFWYQKAAEQDDSEAQAYLAESYYTGFGVEQDYAKAVYWYEKAAEQGHTQVQNRLGYCYKDGVGVERNYEQSIFWFRSAIEQNIVGAYDSLACMYKEGFGIEQNYKQAISLWRSGAEKGCSESKSNLGEMYEFGNGIKQDYEQAISWYQQAIDGGYTEAQEKLNKLQEKIAVNLTRSKGLFVPLLKDSATQSFEDMF